jgi:predicted lysophospholipase L1 biosynthesis ABC-type transport system permease subunit
LGLDSLALETASEVNFASMVAFPKRDASRLTQVRALEGNFPFYGKLETLPADGEANFRSGGKKALVEKALMAQFDAGVGDSIKVGNLNFENFYFSGTHQEIIFYPTNQSTNLSGIHTNINSYYSVY